MATIKKRKPSKSSKSSKSITLAFNVVDVLRRLISILREINHYFLLVAKTESRKILFFLYFFLVISFCLLNLVDSVLASSDDIDITRREDWFNSYNQKFNEIFRFHNPKFRDTPDEELPTKAFLDKNHLRSSIDFWKDPLLAAEEDYAYTQRKIMVHGIVLGLMLAVGIICVYEVGRRLF